MRKLLLTLVFAGVACREADSSSDAQPDAQADAQQGVLDARTADPDAHLSDATSLPIDAGGDFPDVAPRDATVGCVDLTLFGDGDGDGFGTSASTMNACLAPGEQLAGYSREAGDCAPNDPWVHPGGQEICGDFVDDDCTGPATGSTCPTTQAAVVAPNWDCVGSPPNNVYAWAHFSNGGGFFEDGACFVFFEGLRDEFYVERVNLNPVSREASCSQVNGCVCPSLGGWPSYDRRMYAFTLAGETSACPEISIYDNGDPAQPVSNECRKYLLQLHHYDLRTAYVAGSLEAIETRLGLFPTVEVACVHDAPHTNLPYATLLTANIQKNSGFVKQ